MNKNETPGFQLPEETFEDVEGHLHINDAGGPANEFGSDSEAESMDGSDDVEGHMRISNNGLNADRKS